MGAKLDRYFLFSVDLEDVRDMIPNGMQYREGVPLMTQKYLDFLKKHQVTCTFFTVGDIARRYPDLVKKIVDEGHEIACHTNTHIHLDDLGKDNFRKDMEDYLAEMRKLGIENITGFRAPTFSLTKETDWAYEVFEEFGITYSSSVLPAPNPLYGWPDFGQQPRYMGKVLEIPMTLTNLGVMKIPVGGGVYFRMLPKPVLSYLFKKAGKQGQDVLGYFHPYDIDTEQERFMHPNINGNKVYNFLMYYGRGSVFNKLEKVMDMGFKVVRYDEYAAIIKQNIK